MNTRTVVRDKMYDIVIIGGGINGCGIARDAAGRGLSVLLIEKGDLASGTSSASTKLIHGGLRYLEHFELRLVREALRERETLLTMAPHIIWPLRFVLPYEPHLRPAWILSLGLWLYDHLGGRKILPASTRINLRDSAAGRPLKAGFPFAFEYSDCWVDDSRLVVLNAMDAAARGARILTRTEFVHARRGADHWSIALKDSATGAASACAARILINASGAWMNDILAHRLDASVPARVRLVKGSHIVTPRLFHHDRAYIFQNPDGRIIFAIPYEQDFTLIGTTDIDFEGDPGDAIISNAEIDYLCHAASAYFEKPVTPDMAVWTYSGVRPLMDRNGTSAKDVTRDFVLELQHDRTKAALLNVFGGKITTYRRLADEALRKIGHVVPMGKAWTASAPLPGGDLPVSGTARLAAELARSCQGIDAALAARLARTYGTRAWRILESAKTFANLGEHFGAGLTAREVRYLVAHEWARTIDDILWRRTKLGLRLNARDQDRLRGWLVNEIDTTNALGV
ncbi:MAG: glycerol-3-phosphate dehydrogenase [Caulobacterales bacterium]